ncbi:hypothetical protein NY057_05255 [Curtobacterium flaccumfaciens]|uniref:hypothetical protein n=1 Tax=Curtobacterium flaccumfaciens TaxID=2035 RepID=UPI00220FF2C4|nr:hypothetical protein [Curtobacterium flaccumfaciens]UWD83653.1 hypothetical protein NY057_05255 [Curtobacterium flaccumfaciens]
MVSLVSHVHVRDEHGKSHVFGPKSEVPEWAQRLITNPVAWDGEAPSFEDDEIDEDEPARSGRGSSLPVWQAYAKSLEIEFPDDADRNAIIALVDKHKADAKA